MGKQDDVREMALSLLEAEPSGINYTSLIAKLAEKLPTTPLNTVHGSIWDLHKRFPDEVTKPVRGLFLHTKYRQSSPPPPKVVIQHGKSKVTEDAFYESFADYLKGSLEECTEAVALGGNVFRGKWGTPDVIGVFRPWKTDTIQFVPEIVTAEIKINDGELVTAFGQTCAYRLFSHKSYIVVPGIASKEEKSRLESLSMIFGVGLILFDAENPANPNYSIVTRAARHDPDMYYVNKVFEENRDLAAKLGLR